MLVMGWLTGLSLLRISLVSWLLLSFTIGLLLPLGALRFFSVRVGLLFLFVVIVALVLRLLPLLSRPPMGFLRFLPPHLGLCYYAADASATLISCGFIQTQGGSYASSGPSHLRICDRGGVLLDVGLCCLIG